MLTQNWDVSRSLRQGAIGGLMLSPGLHFFLTRVMSRLTFPGYSNAMRIGLRVAIHQACMMPWIQFCLLFTSAVLEPNRNFRERLHAGKNRFQERWRIGFTASMMYWPFVNAFMYSMLQPRFYCLYLDMAARCFSSIMSYITYCDC